MLFRGLDIYKINHIMHVGPLQGILFSFTKRLKITYPCILNHVLNELSISRATLSYAISHLLQPFFFFFAYHHHGMQAKI